MHVAWWGNGPQLRRTTPLKLLDGVTVTTYGAVWPEVILVNAGVAVTEKSLKNIATATFELCAPSVPVTVMFKGLAEFEVSPLTVTVLLWPAVTEVGRNVQVAPPVHASETLSVKEFGAERLTVKVSVVVPI